PAVPGGTAAAGEEGARNLGLPGAAVIGEGPAVGAPTGRRSVARGANPWTPSRQHTTEPRRGDRTCRPEVPPRAGAPGSPSLRLRLRWLLHLIIRLLGRQRSQVLELDAYLLERERPDQHGHVRAGRNLLRPVGLLLGENQDTGA